MKELEAENAKLKQWHAYLALENCAMKNLILKKLCDRLTDGRQSAPLAGRFCAVPYL
jgi:hypothetical protein